MFDNVFKGNYKVEGVDSLEPYYIDKVNLLQGKGNGAVDLDMNLRNLKITGLSSGTLVNHTAILDKLQWISVFKIPKLKLLADYQMKVTEL